MRRILGGVAALLVVTTSACSDGKTNVTAGTAAGVEKRPECISPPNDYDYTADPDDVAGQQRNLESDKEMLDAYSRKHTDDVASSQWVNRPSVRIVVYVAHNLDEHRDRLLPKLKHPDKVSFEKALSSRDEQVAIQSDVNRGDNLASSGQMGEGLVSIETRTTIEGQARAAELHQKYGNKVCITVGGHPYPKGAWPDEWRCGDLKVPQSRDDLEWEVVLDTPTIRRGESGRGTVRITNRGATTVEQLTGGFSDARAFSPGGTDRYGTSGANSARTLMGHDRRLAPGESLELPISFGTDECRPDTDYALPAGSYEVVAWLDGFGRSNAVPVQIVDELNTSSTTLAPAPAVANRPECADKVYPPSTEERQNESGALIADAQKAREYGDQRPDEFSGVALSNESSVRLLVYFTSNLDTHRQALTKILERPDKLDVRKAPQSRKAQEAIVNEAMANHGTLLSAGPRHDGIVQIETRSTAAARDVAQAVHDKYSALVCIKVAGHPFPKGAWPDTTRCPTDPAPTDHTDDVEFTLQLDKTTLRRGEVGTGKGRVTNHGTSAITAPVGAWLEPSVTRSGSNAIVGQLTEGKPSIGLNVHVEPGETEEFPIRFGTDACTPDADYSLPPGTYVVAGHLDKLGRSDDVTITIVE